MLARRGCCTAASDARRSALRCTRKPHLGRDVALSTLHDIALNWSNTRQAALLWPQTTEKHQWVGRGADGFPTLEGEVTEIQGKHLTIRCGR